MADDFILVFNHFFTAASRSRLPCACGIAIALAGCGRSSNTRCGSDFTNLKDVTVPSLVTVGVRHLLAPHFHVPYKGSAPAISDLLGGHIPIMFDSTIAIMPHIKSGKVKPIAISGNKRSPLLPDVPTFAEAGLPIESYAWYGMFVPAKTPKAVVDKINAETQKVMKSPDFQRVLADTGTEYVGDTPENFAKFVQAETTKWSKVVKDSGATVD